MLNQLEFHHIGVATSHLDLTIEQYENLGYLASEITLDNIQKVRICFMSRPAFPLVELIEPTDSTSPVNNILAKSGTTPYHFCYETPRLEQQIKIFKKQKYVLLQQPVAAPALRGRRICFLFHKNMGLIEFVESSIKSEE